VVSLLLISHKVTLRHGHYRKTIHAATRAFKAKHETVCSLPATSRCILCGRSSEETGKLFRLYPDCFAARTLLNQCNQGDLAHHW